VGLAKDYDEEQPVKRYSMQFNELKTFQCGLLEHKIAVFDLEGNNMTPGSLRTKLGYSGDDFHDPASRMNTKAVMSKGWALNKSMK